MTWLHADPPRHNAGYLIGTGIFAAVFIAAVIAQIDVKRFNPWINWSRSRIDDGRHDHGRFSRSLSGHWLPRRRVHPSAGVLASLAVWYLTLGSINVQTVATPRVEIFYWVTITFSQTLGTALGIGWRARPRWTPGLAMAAAPPVFGAGLALLAAIYYRTKGLTRLPVLGRLHPDAPARRDGRRPPRQAHEPRRVGAQLAFSLAGNLRSYCFAHCDPAATPWGAPGRSGGAIRSLMHSSPLSLPSSCAPL